jgi:hypothetical protein
MSKRRIFLSQNMAQEKRVTKSAAARILSISRRTVQRYCQLYAQFGKPITDSRGRLKAEELRDRIVSIKSVERRGFPLGAKRQPSLLAVKRNKKTVGRSYTERLDMVKQEIDSTTDGQQVTLLVSWLRGNLALMFSPVVWQKACEITKLLRGKGNDLV